MQAHLGPPSATAGWSASIDETLPHLKCSLWETYDSSALRCMAELISTGPTGVVLRCYWLRTSARAKCPWKEAEDVLLYATRDLSRDALAIRHLLLASDPDSRSRSAGFRTSACRGRRPERSGYAWRFRDLRRPARPHTRAESGWRRLGAGSPLLS